MAGGRPRRRRPRRRKARQGSTSTATHISSFGEDVVLEIFLRLSSFPTLVRAALTCRAWRRAVAASPDFRRRFRALHPAPPLLGLFLYNIGFDELYRPPCGPSFVPAGFRDWDLAGAVRGGDFFLTSLLERPTDTKSSSPYPYWQILDCCGGRVLLTDTLDQDNKPLIVLNPLIRRSAHEFRYPGPDQDPAVSSFRLICSDEDPPSSFRVVHLAYVGCTLQASVFSSDTGEWSALPGVELPARLANAASGEASERIWIGHQFRMYVNGFVYWIYFGWLRENGHENDGMCLIALDTTTMEFSFADLPDLLQDCALCGGEAEDRAACIVYSDGSNKVGVVKHTRGDDCVDRWVPDRVLRLELDGELERLHLTKQYCFNSNQLSVIAVRDGYVYFSVSEPPSMEDTRRGSSWFMSLCLATMKVEKLFERSCDDEAYEYIMPWPPCLLAGDYGQFAFEGAL